MGRPIEGELPEQVRLPLIPAKPDESQKQETASLLPGGDDRLSPHEGKIFALLEADKATHIDEVVERPDRGNVVLEDVAARFDRNSGEK